MRAFENHPQWKAVKNVCAILTEAGHQAYLVGGCVRDMLMEREPNDFDVATSATPDEVEGLFERSVAVGKAFGVIVIPFDGFQIEVATFREDLEYKDGRRPEGVKFSTPEVDAKRRDFTVNALFYDLAKDEVIDFVGGQADIEAQIIRTVGDPKARFSEDQLRLLRAVRFSAQLQFSISPETFDAIFNLAPASANVSRERVRDEILKLLSSGQGRDKGLEQLLSTGLFQSLFTRLAMVVFAEEDEWRGRFIVAQNLGYRDPIFLLSLFFLPGFEAAMDEKSFREDFLKDLRLDNRSIERILFTLRHREEFLHPLNERPGKMAHLLAHQDAACAENLASVLERMQSVRSFAAQTERERNILAMRKRLLDPQGRLPEAWLSGADLKNAGIAPGPKMGEVLQEALFLQIEGSLKTREAALEWLSRYSFN